MAAFHSLMLAGLEASVGLHQVATFAAAATVALLATFAAAAA
jgi:hypothetical protein